MPAACGVHPCECKVGADPALPSGLSVCPGDRDHGGDGQLGLDLAEVPHGEGIRVGVFNPLRVKAYRQSELACNKTDTLDAALIARFCQAQQPTACTLPATHLRELREPARRCDNLKVARVQEINQQKSGTASPVVEGIDNGPS